LLAAARWPGDQNAAVGGSHFFDGLAQLVDGDRAADHLKGIAAPLAHLAILAFEPRRLERAGCDQHEAISLERLLDIVVGATLDRLVLITARALEASRLKREKREL